jgi:hypothetical protein
MCGKRAAKKIIGLLCICTFWGCFGFASGNVEYQARTSPWTTKAELRAALGEPVRITTEESLET